MPLPSLLLALPLAACLALPTVTRAQDFPSKPLRIVVPAAPGGTVDILARGINQRLGERLGQPVVVENRAGAATNAGNELVAKSPPDGHTLLMAGPTLATNPALFEKLGYDPQKDLAPITHVASVENVLVVNPQVAASSVKELVALAKARPGAINFASAGTGASGHLAGELFKSLAGIDIVHVSYKGAAPAHADLLAGQVQMMFDNIPAALQLVRAGRLKALATTGARRSALLPDVPTMIEAGVPDFESSAWFGLLAPAGTPAAVMERLHRETVAVLREPEVRDRLTGQGYVIVANTPEQFRRYIEAETVRWGKVIRGAGIKAS
jgi:tripartite-type tricarboxylate transporter receptor subunit TctC